MVTPAAHVSNVAALVDQRGIIPESNWEAYVTGWRCPSGTPLMVVAPGSIEQLRDVMRYCVAERLEIVPQGANTGLVGASVPDDSSTSILLSTARLTAIRTFSKCDAVAVVEAGVRLSTLNQHVGESGLQLGIDLGADPSIGGMVATNTGGSRMLRYGDMRRHLLGVEIILADDKATILSNLSLVRKDNSRMAWGQLVAGAGGALGIVTAAALSLDPVPVQTATVMMGLKSLDALPIIVPALRGALGETLSAVEGISGTALETVLEQQSNLRNPFSGSPPAYLLLVEAATRLSPRLLDLQATLLDAIEGFMADLGDGLIDAIVLPPRDAWALRHSISGALSRSGEVIGLDVSVPLAMFPAFRTEAEAFLAASHPQLRLCDFGHCGDGGVHFNIVIPPAVAEADRAWLRTDVRQRIYAMVATLGGSFSAEHGLGPANGDAYMALVPAAERAVIGAVRRIFDPAELVSRALPKYTE
jgi:FAD/FMN-containing dehydrogenase